VDEELRWFFSVHDGLRGSPFFEELAARRHPEVPESDDHEARVYRQIRERLLGLSDHDAGVLKAAYTPRPWPPRLRDELGRLTGIVVRLASAETEWPSETSEQELREVKVAKRLDLAVVTVGREVLAAYRTPARALLKRAVGAYRAARDAEPTAGGRRA
jgi:hypothetical protein